MLYTSEKILSIPRKIEYICYPPGAGGDFFSSLVTMSSKATRVVLQKRVETKDINGDIKLSHGKLKTIRSIIRYKTIHRYLAPIYIQHIAPSLKHHEETLMFFEDSYDISDFYYHTHVSLILAFAKYHNLGLDFLVKHSDNDTDDLYTNMYNLYKDILIILPQHRINWRKTDHLYFDQPRNPWTTLNITPESREGRFITDFSHELFFQVNQYPSSYDTLENIGDDYFPFMDYMIHKDYPTIIKFILNRYGDELDTSILQKELIRYYTLRIAPMLELSGRK